MTHRRLLTVLAALLLAATLIAPVGADEHEEGDSDLPYPTEWVTIGTQAAGTFGTNEQQAQLGTMLGADLREARIRMPDAETVEFEIRVEELPATGGTPEFIRYTWDFFVDGEEAQLDGKYTNYSRGTCDPTSGQCDPENGKMPRDPGERPFFFRGNLNQIELPLTTFNAMEELALLRGDFDVEEATITVAVPVEAINLLDGVEFEACSEITSGSGLFGGTVETAPSAYVTYGSFPSDTILGTATFTVPLPADAEVDCDGNPIEDQ